jgi:hypothetical protein
MFFFSIFFLLNIKIYFCFERIKSCEFSKTCLNKNNFLDVQIFFKKYPKFVGNGELISNSNSSIIYYSEVKLSKDKKSLFYKFFPSIPGKYYLKFNKNLQCPNFITITNNFRTKIMTHILFILESQKIKETNFIINIIFNETISFSKNLYIEEDINKIELVENVDKVNLEENRFEDISKNCELIKNENKIICNVNKKSGFSTKEKIENLGIYFHDRCGKRNTFGFINVLTTKNKINNLKSSNLELLKGYKMKDYQKNEEIVLFFVVSLEKNSHLNYLENIISEFSNKFNLFNFVYLTWTNFSYVTEHFNLKDNGKIKFLIYDFRNENTFITDLNEKENGNDLEIIINNLINKNLIWTSQSLSEKFFDLLHLNLTKSQQDKLYFNFGVIGFIFLLILRCYLVNKNRPKEPKNIKFQEKKKIN